MTLSDDVKQAAQRFGEAVRTNQTVEWYLQADAALQADRETRELDQRYQAMFESLAARQRAGEPLPQDELDTFYELQEQVREHSLMQDRNKKLAVAKGYLQHLGAEFNQKLGLDYVTLVLS
ncbi:MAG: YlbF family regulator [Candidatus Promineifilaceae bacterium]